MSNKKSTSKTNAQGEIAKLAEQAALLEDAGHWGEAAQVWQRISSHKNASKKTRAEAKGRVAAALVRAEAKNAKAEVAQEVEPPVEVTPENDTAATGDAPVNATEDGALSMEAAPESAPADDVAPTPPTPEPDASTGDGGGEGGAAESAAGEGATPEEPKPATEAKSSGARLPEVGTVIQKRDRKGELRCECKVVEGGIEYKGTVYKSLSAAALAASKDLGLGASTLDGWAWWGLKTRPALPVVKKNVGEKLERAFTKYRERVAQVIKDATGDDLIRVTNLLKAQGAELIAMVEPAESAGGGSTPES